MTPMPATGEEVLQRCLSENWITTAQAGAARREAEQRHATGDRTPMTTLLYALGFLDQQRAMALLQAVAPVLATVPQHIGPYAVFERMAAGGMGEIYRAVDGAGRTVALKLLPASQMREHDAERRFRREARAGRRIRHPHVVRTIDAGKDGAQHWLAMELVPGPTLRQRVNAGAPLSEPHALILLAQVACAMRAAWRCRVLHRDIKPSNIILAPARHGRDEPFSAKLCDFGLAKAWRTDPASVEGSSMLSLTTPGMALGTPHYMSPEQAMSLNDVDQRSDIYSLGATLFNALTGETVHTASDSQSVMVRQVRGTIDFARLRERQISPPFVTLLERMLAKDPAQRLRDWEWVIADLRILAPGAVATVEADENEPSAIDGTSSRLGWTWPLGIALAFAALGAATWWLLRG